MTQETLARHDVHVIGSGTTAMLLGPGLGCNQSVWRFVAPAFAATHRVVLFDYVGLGNSDFGAYDPERYSSLEGYAQDVLDICDALQLARVIFVGHSVGGMIGLLASLREPDRFARLILIGASARYLDDPPEYVGGTDRATIEEALDLMEKNYPGWASYAAPLMIGHTGRPDLVRELESSIGAADPAIARRFTEVAFFSDNRALLPRVSVPSLLLQCLEDISVPQAAADYLHRHLPLSTMRQINAIGHYPHLSHPQQTVELIQTYLHTTLST